MVESLLRKVKKKNPSLNEELVRKAYDYSKRMHEGQRRVAGGPYHEHCYAVAWATADFYPEAEAISAALLHDVVEDTNASVEDVEELFGPRIAFIVEGLTEDKSVESYAERKMRYRESLVRHGLKDERVFVIKFADLMHNLETITALGRGKALRFAREVLEFYAPLAEKLGLKTVAELLAGKAEEVVAELRLH